MAGILGTALSGLMAFQRSLDTTSHNIANVNTDGYSRQRVELSTRPAEFTGAGYIGQGVNVATVARSYDQFITHQLTSSTAAYTEAKTLFTLAAQVDSIASDTTTGLSPAMKAFFNAVNEVANDPSSLPARQVMVSESESLTKQFNTLSAKFEDFRKQTNNQMQATVDTINAFAESIATLNHKISSGAASGQPNNDLLDQRDALVAKLAENISVSTLDQQDGSISVFIGKGQSLVLGVKTTGLSLAGSSTDPDHKEILMGGQTISKQITGGALSGALEFRDTVLDPAQQQLGLLSASFALEFNKLHAAPGAAFDLNGNQGTDLFSFGTLPIISTAGSTGTISAVYDPTNSGNLKPSDYRLDYDGANYSLTRLVDNTQVTLPATFPGTPAAVEGMTLTQAAAPTGPSSFLIRPTFAAAKQLTALLTDPLKIAAAGTTGSPGDNTVALSLADLEKKALLLGGKGTFNDAYAQLVTQVGTLTYAAKINNSAQETLFNQVQQSRENLAGVNLDEEAANLIKYQQSYQAAAQVISVARSLFDTLISSVR